MFEMRVGIRRPRGIRVRPLIPCPVATAAFVAAAWLGASSAWGLEFEREIETRTARMPRALAAGDFDGNGVADVVVAGAFRELVIHMNGNTERSVVGDLAESPRDVCVTDIDADGRDDIVVVYGENRLHAEQPELAVLRNVGEEDTGVAFARIDLDIDQMARLVDPLERREVPMGPKISPRRIAAGRIDARLVERDPPRWEVDHFPELVVLDEENRVFVLLNEHGHFRSGLGYRLGVTIHDLHLAPLDDNESDDLLLAFADPGNHLVRPEAEGGVDRPGGVLLLYSLNTPDALIGAADRLYLRHIARSGAIGTAVATTDYDYDGDRDIVFTSVLASGEVASARAVTVRNVFDEIVDPLRDPGLTGLREFPLPNSAPVELLAGDFDDDLMGDVLVRFENREIRFVRGHPRQLLFEGSETVAMPPTVNEGIGRLEALEYHGDDYLDLVFTTSDGPDGRLHFLKNSYGGPVETARRGDVDGRPGLTLTDGVFLLDHLFRQGASPECPEAADVNGDGSFNLTDAVALLSYLFAGGREPATWTPGLCAAGAGMTEPD